MKWLLALVIAALCHSVLGWVAEQLTMEELDPLAVPARATLSESIVIVEPSRAEFAPVYPHVYPLAVLVSDAAKFPFERCFRAHTRSPISGWCLAQSANSLLVALALVLPFWMFTSLRRRQGNPAEQPNSCD